MYICIEKCQISICYWYSVGEEIKVIKANTDVNKTAQVCTGKHVNDLVLKLKLIDWLLLITIFQSYTGTSTL
jgi:hypothetical protein